MISPHEFNATSMQENAPPQTSLTPFPSATTITIQWIRGYEAVTHRCTAISNMLKSSMKPTRTRTNYSICRTIHGHATLHTFSVAMTFPYSCECTAKLYQHVDDIAALPCLLAPPKFPCPTTQRCVIGRLFSTATLINVRAMPPCCLCGSGRGTIHKADAAGRACSKPKRLSLIQPQDRESNVACLAEKFVRGSDTTHSPLSFPARRLLTVTGAIASASTPHCFAATTMHMRGHPYISYLTVR